MTEHDARAPLIRVCALALVLAGCAGDAQPPEDCSHARDFVYDASYTELSGTCGPYVGYPVHFASNLATESRFVGNTRIVPEYQIVDCTLRMVQTALEDDAVVERITGDLPIHGEEDGSIRGEVMIERFDGSSEPTCSGEYDLVLTPRPGPSAR